MVDVDIINVGVHQYTSCLVNIFVCMRCHVHFYQPCTLLSIYLSALLGPDDIDQVTTARPITPILCRAKKPIDSPSKHVSFKMEKENDMSSITSKMDILRERESNLYALRERDRNTQEYQRRKELRERLEKAKQRASELRAVEIESRIRS